MGVKQPTREGSEKVGKSENGGQSGVPEKVRPGRVACLILALFFLLVPELAVPQRVLQVWGSRACKEGEEGERSSRRREAQAARGDR